MNHSVGQTVIVLGGGVGGIVAANTLRRKLDQKHRVILIEKDAMHSFAPSFLWVMTGERQPAQVRVPLAGLLMQGVELLRTEVTGIDTAAREVRTSSGQHTFDVLVVALGAHLAPGSMAGLNEAIHTFYTLDGAARLRDSLAQMGGGRIAVVVASIPYKCPGAPHEGAMLIADSFRKRGLASRVKVDLYTPEAQPMPVAGPQLGAAVQSMLSGKGIGFHPLHKLKAVDAGSQTLTFENETSAPYDLLVAIPPHRAPAAVEQSGLLNAAGWIPVNPQTLETSVAGIYAIGDITAVPIPGRWKAETPLMLPKAGVFAHAQGEIVAERIASTISGRTADQIFTANGYCMLESGADEAGFAFGDFYAQPAPEVKLRQIGKSWHWGKILFEQWWLSPPGLRRTALGWAMKAGGKLYGIPVQL